MTALSVTGLAKSYGPLEVLKNVDLDVARGEVVAIIGPSGSGKSTFIRCLNRLEEPDAGTVMLDGAGLAPSLTSKELRALRRKVGMVFQSFNLFPTHTALENVVLPQVHSLGRSRQQAEARARELLAKVGLGERADHKPAQLSGGQQQRVAIARALALDPEIMLFDEPTSAIDPELRVEVLRVMRDVAAEGMTMLVVTHEMNFARQVADRVVFFADGTIVEQAEPAAFFASPQHERTRRFLAAVLEEEL
ncbi:MAG: amino acid ABC transporter ATP-binding protein [Arthrobacter sp.]|nr:amino acid ABC transporter ATP-binding protein [Arthrobacter sp.]